MRCKMCYEWGEMGTYSTNPNLRPKTLDFQIVRNLIKLLAHKTYYYSLFGGEPLLYPYLEELVFEIKKSGAMIDTPTNGTLLTKHAQMLVRCGFDSIRVSIDGPRHLNDEQRGRGAYDKAMAGIEALFREREKPHGRGPVIGIIYTVTPENHLGIEQFFLKDLDIKYVNWATIQLQNFITSAMGKAYASFLKREFSITSDVYWQGLVRAPTDFAQMNIGEMCNQIRNVVKKMWSLGKPVTLLPPTLSEENYHAYFRADWQGMSDRYRSCPVPWSAVDITAGGDVAPCHIFYDLTMGNLYHDSFEAIWNSDKYNKFRSWIKKHGLMPICYGCCILYIVGNRISETSFEKKGSKPSKKLLMPEEEKF